MKKKRVYIGWLMALCGAAALSAQTYRFHLQLINDNLVMLSVPDYLPFRDSTADNDASEKSFSFKAPYGHTTNFDTLLITVSLKPDVEIRAHQNETITAIKQFLQDSTSSTRVLKTDTMTVDTHKFCAIESITNMGGGINGDYEYRFYALSYGRHLDVSFTGKYIGHHDYKKYTTDFYRSLRSLKYEDVDYK